MQIIVENWEKADGKWRQAYPNKNLSSTLYNPNPTRIALGSNLTSALTKRRVTATANIKLLVTYFYDVKDAVNIFCFKLCEIINSTNVVCL
jgi:hypothetical protein